MVVWESTERALQRRGEGEEMVEEMGRGGLANRSDVIGVRRVK